MCQHRNASLHSGDVARSIQNQIEASIIAQKAILDQIENIVGVIAVVAASLHKGRFIYLFGNGGSAADAQHIAAEFTGRFLFERPSLPAIALTANTSALTAIGNDYGFERIFARQIEGFGRPGDVAIGISTSGTSANVVEGLRTAAALGMRTVGFTGIEGRGVAEIAEFCISVPVNGIARVQECHTLLGHIICEQVEHALFG